MSDKAILCGINNYKSISDLRGCVNDVHNVRRLLSESLGFDAGNIQTYVDDEVTKERVSDSFRWLADGAEEGDRLLFHFSGHGSYIPSEDDDEELDELVCLYDMDWAAPDTYLIDEDLGELTRLVKKGRLTVILDCCHSGTGTRAITAGFALARAVSPKSRLIVVSDTASQLETGRGEDNLRRLTTGNTALFRSFREERARPVFARFATPPAEYRVDTPRAKVKRLSAAVRAESNHQLLAGARDDQTAADAFIGGEYNGAFSFYLCETVRELGVQSYNEIIEATTGSIRANGYSQVPQNEGPFGEEALLGGSAGAPPDDDFDSAFDGPPVARPTGLSDDLDGRGEGTNELDPLATLNQLLRVSEKLLDLQEEGRQPARTHIGVRAVADEAIVYVHGISNHQPGFSRLWFEAMFPYLARPLPRFEVVWSHHVNSRGLQPARAVEHQALALEIRAELEKRTEEVERQAARCQPAGMERAAVRMIRPRGLSIDDFVRYMLVTSTREAILNEFFAVVAPLLAAGKKVRIISHSWGTVVSYEGMRRLGGRSFAGGVANLFTVGAALAIGAVQRNLFGRVTDGRLPAHVDRVINLDAGGDIVGGRIGDVFAVHREHLGLFPTGCGTIPFTDIAFDPSCAHGSYFQQANRAVNRDIFAAEINVS